VRVVFADTCFFIGICHPRDGLHKKATDLYVSLANDRIVTSDLVLVEFMNGMSAFGGLRQETTEFIDLLHAATNIEIVAFSSQRFRQSVAHYKRFYDKQWSLTDCDSMLLAEQRGIQEIATRDHHFEQASFKALLRD
jgi:uncharacterized protein